MSLKVCINRYHSHFSSQVKYSGRDRTSLIYAAIISADLRHTDRLMGGWPTVKKGAKQGEAALH